MIPISLIRQYHFCPRIVYFAMLTNIKPIYPKYVKLGLEYHDIQSKLSKNRKFKKLGIEFERIIIDRYLEDETLQIGGKVDLALLNKSQVIPIEFKNIKPKHPSWSHILQLYGYGYLLSKNYNLEFKQAIILYSNNVKLFKIDITPKIESAFFKTLEKIKEIIDKNTFPDSSASISKCVQCEYLNFCGDRI